jgi:PBP1b-binding outer membrane lipoprotein LpoB
MKIISILLLIIFLNACSTAVAVVDATGSAVVYAGKTIVNSIDAITPDIVNR